MCCRWVRGAAGLPVCRQEGGAEIGFTYVDGCVTLSKRASCSVHNVLVFGKYAGKSCSAVFGSVKPTFFHFLFI